MGCNFEKIARIFPRNVTDDSLGNRFSVGKNLAPLKYVYPSFTVRASDQHIIDRQGLQMQMYLLLVLILFYSQASTRLQILWVFTGRGLTNDCSYRHSSPESTCANSCYRSRPDHLRVTRARNPQQTIQGTVIRGNRGGTSTAAKNKRKTNR